MKKIKKTVYKIFATIISFGKKICNHIMTVHYKNMMAKCGKNVSIENYCDGNWQNIHCGTDVHIGKNNLFMCALASIYIGDHVMFGPNVTVVTGDHRIDVIGRYMTSIKSDEKLPENDQPIVFEGDNWIGANTTILKGITIGKGAVIASGAVVNKSIPPYEIWGGYRLKKLKLVLMKKKF